VRGPAKEGGIMYQYKDFLTGKIKATRGKFAGWTKSTGLLDCRYAIFRNPKGWLFIPEFSLTKETRERLVGEEGG